MNVDARIPSPLQSRSPRRGPHALLAIPFASTAAAQTSTGGRGVQSPELLRVVERLDPLAIGLIVAGVLIVLLMILRITSMIRRERPVVPPAPRRNAGERTQRDTTDRAPLTGHTDWGFDQNKRSSQSRAAVDVGDASGLVATDRAKALWSATDVENAAAISKQANDGMGKPPNLPPSPYITSHNPYFQGDSTITAPIEVVEVADALLQAELLVQLGDPKQAMILLSQHIRDTEHPGPAVWLMLLDLYQTTGRKSQYEALALGFKTLFNAAVPAWATSAETSSRDLETYAPVMMKLQTGWPGPTVRPMLEGLLNDDRGGSRQGFSLAAYRDILFLLEILNVLDQMTVDATDRERIQSKLDAPV